MVNLSLGAEWYTPNVSSSPLTASPSLIAMLRWSIAWFAPKSFKVRGSAEGRQPAVRVRHSLR